MPMKYIAIIEADEKPVSCKFIGCNGNVAPYLIGETNNIEALDQESIDYKAQYERFLGKAEIVISQLRADRDSLLEVLDKIRDEIESQRKEASNKNSENDVLRAFYDGLNDGLKDARDIIDKYKEKIDIKQESEKKK